MPVAFICFGVETVFPQASEQFADVFLMLFEIIGIDEDVIEIDHNAFVKQISKDVVHKPLERGRRVGEAERHD